jgi:hypothetical protein
MVPYRAHSHFDPLPLGLVDSWAGTDLLVRTTTATAWAHPRTAKHSHHPSTDDPHEYLQFLATEHKWAQPNKLEGPPTATRFPFQAQDRMNALNKLWTQVVEPSWQAYRSGSFSDKKMWSTGFIHGTSGVGKTRFDLEFLSLLADFLAPDPSAPAWNDEVEPLRAALQNSKTVVLELRHNGYALEDDEVKWPPAVILGLRLAHQYWSPHVPYPKVRNAFRSQVTKDPTLWDTFRLARVLDAAMQHKAAPTHADPSPRIPEVLHIAVDEIQTAFDHMVPYWGGGGGDERSKRLEPLSTALNRALQGAVSQTRGFFVIGTLSGTAARHMAEVLDATDATTASVLLSPLSADAVRQLVASFRLRPNQPGQRAIVSGREWLTKGGKPFERLLATIGGNPRAVECLERVLRIEGSPPESLDLNDISVKLIEQVRLTFNIESWGRHGSGRFGLLLALAGIPVTRDSVVDFEPATPQQQPRPITVAELERAGLVHLRPPPQSHRPDHWVNMWGVKGSVVMEVPFVLAQAALALTSDLSERDLQLVNGASRLLADFYPTAASFERLALAHRVLRHNIASEWARRQRLAYVQARDLFCGTICHPSLVELRFVPAAAVRRVSGASAAGVWWTMAVRGAQEVPPTSVTLRDDTKVELSSTSPYAILLSGSNAVDGLLNEQLWDPLHKVSVRHHLPHIA